MRARYGDASAADRAGGVVAIQRSDAGASGVDEVRAAGPASALATWTEAQAYPSRWGR